MPSEHKPDTLGVRAGGLRSDFQEHSEMLALTTSFVYASAAEAARKVAAGEPGAAAIGSRPAADRYGLALLAESIQDVDENFTRFVLLAQADEAPTGSDRTSIAFTLDRDRPGGLYEVLGELASRGINLSKIESRPMKQALGHYVFFIDFEAHRLEPAAAEALAGVRARVHRLWLLGSYPRGGAA